MKQSVLRQIVREVLTELLDEDLTTEMNTTGSVGGEYNTPYAFASSNKKQTKKWKDIHNQLGFSVVRDMDDEPVDGGELGESIEAVQDMNALLSTVPKDSELRDDEGKTFNDMKLKETRLAAASALKILAENVNEAKSSYGSFKDDDSKSPRHKIACAIKDVKHSLREVQKQMSLLKKFKNESELSPDDYWKRTHINFGRIKEYVTGLVQDLRELEKNMISTDNGTI